MKSEVKTALCSALRSGEYKQGRNVLKKIDRDGVTRHCCLGVLTELYVDTKHVKEGWKKPRRILDDRRVQVYPYGRQKDWDMPKKAIRNWAGIDAEQTRHLAGMNDKGRSFKQIADYIEKNL